MPSLADQASRSIKMLIEQHHLLPGMHINIDSLAVDLCMSQTPIREALRKLATEGIVIHTPKTGYAVSNLTINEYIQILEVLRVLESYAVKELAKRPFLVDLKKLYSINGELRKNILSYDKVFFCHINDEFHKKLTENYNNVVMKKHFFFLWDGIRSKRDCMYCNSQWANIIVKEHEMIIKAIENGDPIGAEKAVITHYNSGKDSAEAHFK
ncbi:MAG: GntR family transcriptional regulator [Synergistes jonesii]|uniref:GntR family transcriptional regulator n=1 Tax=Synergistes jonesii TaxID=2754 RepID=UPI002A76367F|nr:GntR family transcriptional regulator [Synergistes jonesii]MDY2985135.1 GntR family transcriptional regulator [Synergistes jonesii]